MPHAPAALGSTRRPQFIPRAKGCKLVALTYRRLIIVGINRKKQETDETIIDLQHIVDHAFVAHKYGGIITLQTNFKQGYSIFVYQRPKRLWEKLHELLDKQAKGKALASVADGLEKLGELVHSGILSAEDFDRAKDLLLGKAKSEVESSLEMLGDLYSLYKQGALSESEFNMKKWEILSR